MLLNYILTMKASFKTLKKIMKMHQIPSLNFNIYYIGNNNNIVITNKC